ncbi:MAG: 3-oxoadipate enol-lactonase [Rhodocyclaceae bacterium]|nr:MAG: 3-oxoadipate enol-lactonase [Rhodocyclaceae bacterium]
MKVHANGIDLNCDIAGTGPWLTLSHSLACDLSMWDPQMAALAPHFTVLRFDTRGHGLSSAPPEDAYDWGRLAGDVLGLFDELKIERSHFVGLSMGGMIGQHVALRAPERIARLVLADTSSRYPAGATPIWDERIRLVREQGMEVLVDGTLERWFTAPFRAAHPEITARIAGLIRNTPPAGYIGCGRTIPTLDITQRLPAITNPTLVIVGAEDAGTPPAMAQEIAGAIPGARLEIIPDAAHLSNIEQAEIFNRLLLEFLTSADPLQ